MQYQSHIFIKWVVQILPHKNYFKINLLWKGIIVIYVLMEREENPSQIRQSCLSPPPKLIRLANYQIHRTSMNFFANSGFWFSISSRMERYRISDDKDGEVEFDSRSTAESSSSPSRSLPISTSPSDSTGSGSSDDETEADSFSAATSPSPPPAGTADHWSVLPRICCLLRRRGGALPSPPSGRVAPPSPTRSCCSSSPIRRGTPLAVNWISISMN